MKECEGSRNGSTMIDLLVVIALIALLGSMNHRGAAMRRM
jgi:Tfp pilus assembly protein FimT